MYCLITFHYALQCGSSHLPPPPSVRVYLGFCSLFLCPILFSGCDLDSSDHSHLSDSYETIVLFWESPFLLPNQVRISGLTRGPRHLLLGRILLPR
jgi:hypothetical protein